LLAALPASVPGRGDGDGGGQRRTIFRSHDRIHRYRNHHLHASPYLYEAFRKFRRIGQFRGADPSMWKFER
jgi:hypothetical protein